jgi:hypothetical protein
MTDWRPVLGSTANWMLQPPHSMPISRMILSASSRIFWYSRSVSVWAGATVIESPVWTPIGSKFSIEQTMTQLSFLSRITSSSYSFQPKMDSSIRHLAVHRLLEAVLDDLLVLLDVVGDAAAGAAHREAGADHEGKGDGLEDPAGVLHGVGVVGLGEVEADLLHRLLEELAVLGLADDRRRRRRSSRRCTWRAVPRSCSLMAVLSAVWPPRVGSSASGAPSR